MTTTEKKIRKGGLARINEAVCFTTKNGGERKYPLINYRSDDARIIEGRYRFSQEEQRQWYEDLRADVAAGRDVGHDSAGEPKLAPRNGHVTLHAGKVYPVLRARCRVEIAYRMRSGYMIILDVESGHEVMIDRELMEAV